MDNIIKKTIYAFIISSFLNLRRKYFILYKFLITKKIMIPDFLKKKSEIQLDFIFKNVHYKIQGISKVKNNIVYLNFGHYGDEFPCIMNEYNSKKNEFWIHKLRAQSFGGWNEDDRVICLKPELPAKGALDVLVMLSIAIAEYIDENCKVYINDDAKIDNNYPLSWRKFFTKGETTYSKYGFILRDPKDSIDSFQEELDILELFLQDSISEHLSKSVIQIIKKEVDLINKKLKEKKKPVIHFNEEEKFEKLIKEVLETRKYDKIMDLVDKELNIDLRGVWFLSWEYYESYIPEKYKVLDLVIKTF